MRSAGQQLALVLVTCLALAGVGAGSSSATVITRVEFLGEARLQAGLRVEDTPVGGLSAITYDQKQDRYLVASDDPSGRAAARFYSLKIDLDAGRLEPGALEVLGQTLIQAPTGGPMGKLTVDPEGIALSPDGDLYISSEGQIRSGVPPFVRRYSRAGEFVDELPLPTYYRPTKDRSSGPRHNLVFEGLGLTPDGSTLFVAMENALLQDGPAASRERGSPSRVLEFDTERGELVAEYLYRTEAVAAPATVDGGIEVNGVVELLPLDGDHLLVMERSFSMGVGNTIRIFEADLSGATDISVHPALADVDESSIRAVDKELVVDLAGLDLYLDNLEGMSFGPELPDGRRSLILVADDNFNPLVQTSQFLAFALDHRTVTIEAVQGAGHESPFDGQWVRGLVGTVTGLRSDEEAGFWVESQDQDGDPATSRGLLVLILDSETDVGIGDRIEAAGRITERRRRAGDLSTTTLAAHAFETIAVAQEPPPPIRIGEDGLRPPTVVIDDDGLEAFEPRFDGLDFWESLEGMRIVVPAPVVVGPTNRYGDLVVATDPGPVSVGRTDAGGLLMRPGDANPGRLVVVFESEIAVPPADVGDRFDADLAGILDYDYGRYRLRVPAAAPPLRSSRRQPETTTLGRRQDRWTVASFNVWNLSARSEIGRFERLARQIVVHLNSPDIISLQEIQDDSGVEDDGTVRADRTLQQLIDWIERVGGPRYEARQIDPVDKGDGGRPGANIRVAYLFDPVRIGFTDRAPERSTPEARVVVGPAGAQLRENPFRLDPGARAFSGDANGRFSASRKPLVGEFTLGDETLYLVNLHLTSKLPDGGTFGSVQPPVRISEDQRSQQARWVADLVGEILAADPTAGVMILGDLNEHEFRAPLRILESIPMVNLIDQLQESDRYSYVHQGVSQMLDHALVSPGLAARADISFDVVHINADYADGRSASDHDPIVVELRYGDRD